MPLETGVRIFKGHPHGFNSFIVTGDRGIGKSSYALKVAFEVYVHLGCEKKEAWNKALKCCKFHIKDVIGFLKESTLGDTVKPIMIWDDVGLHASGSKYFLNMKMVDQLKAVLDTIRTAISGLVMTCPTTKGLLSMINAYDDYKLIVFYSNRGGMYREVTAYKWRTLPSGKRLIKTQYCDSYNCYIPNQIFYEYMELRKNALKETLEKLETSINE